MGHFYGYARVSTLDQNPRLQRDALKAAGCEKIFTDRASGKLDRRPDWTSCSSVCWPMTRWWCGAWTASDAASGT